MDRVEQVQYFVDRAIEKIGTDERYRSLARLSREELRRLLAEAHYRDSRALRTEIEAERDQAEREGAAPDETPG